MIDKIQNLAQSLGNELSRRSFLGGVGRGAALVALAFGCVLVMPHNAHAGRPCTDDSNCPGGQRCGEDGRCHGKKAVKKK